MAHCYGICKVLNCFGDAAAIAAHFALSCGETDPDDVKAYRAGLDCYHLDCVECCTRKTYDFPNW